MKQPPGGDYLFSKLFGSSGRPGGLRLGAKRAERYLCGVEELAAVLVLDSVDEHSVGGRGNEIADAFMVDESGHGFAVCRLGVIGCDDFVLSFCFFGVKAAQPCLTASGDCGVIGHRAGRGVGFEKDVGWQCHGEISFHGRRAAMESTEPGEVPPNLIVRLLG